MKVGVVVAHGATQTLCDWLGEAERLARGAGARVLVVDRRGVGSSPAETAVRRVPGDLVTGAQWLRGRGVSKVALLGSSMGGPLALTAAARLTPTPCAVIAVSPALVSGEGDDQVNAGELEKLPSPVWLPYETGNPAIARNAEHYQRRLGARLLPVPGKDHSVDLVARHDDVRRFLVQAVRSCGGA